MAVTAAPRTGITRWSAETDPFTRTQADADHALLDALVAIDVQDLLANRPAPGIRGRFFTQTDGLAGVTWREDGTTWRAVGSRIVPASSSDVGQIIRGAASQSASLKQYQDSSGSAIGEVTSDGTLSRVGFYKIGGGADPSNFLNSRGATQRGLVVFGYPSQSADVLAVQDSSGTVNMFRVSPTAVTVGSGMSFAAPSAQLGSSPPTSAVLNVVTGAAGTTGVLVKAAASQTADLTDWTNSSGSRTAYIGPDGNFGQVQAGATVGAKFAANGTGTELWMYSVTDSTRYVVLSVSGSTFQAAANGVTPMTVQGYTAQSTYLQTWKNSGGFILAYIDSDGSFVTGSNASITGTLTSGPANVGLLNTSASQIQAPSLAGAPGGPVWKYLYWDSNATIGRIFFGATVSSSVEAKRDIEAMASVHVDRLLDMTPKRFRYKDEVHHGTQLGKPAPHYFGLLAEDLLDAGLRDLVLVDEDDKPVTIYYDRIGAMLLPVIRDLRARVSTLEAANARR